MLTTLILKSIADDTRLAIIRKLAMQNTELPCKSIVEDCSVALKLTQPTMSHHITKLVQSNVVIERKVGKEKFYTLNKQLLAQHGINPHKI